MKKLSILTILLIINLANAIPQDLIYRLDSLTQVDGFSYHTPFCLLHDSRGFMWFGARDGLKRYDGYRFKSFYHSEIDSASLSDNNILSMVEDNQGNIWIGTMYGGLNQYDRDKDEFTRIPGSGDDPYNLKKTCVIAIEVLRSGEICFSAQSANSQGVYCYFPRTGEIVPIMHDTVDTERITEVSGSSFTVRTRTILEDKQGDIWIGDAKGLHRYDPENRTFLHYRSDPEDPNSISSNTIHSLYEDSAGNLWVGTRNGLNRMDRNRKVFQRYFHDPANPNSLRSNYIGAISEDYKGNLILRTSVGIEFLDVQNANFTNWEFINLYGFDFSMLFARKQLYVDESGIIWFATPRSFYKLIPEQKKFLFASVEGFYPGVIYSDDGGEIWIGTWGTGLYKVVPDASGSSLQRLQEIMSDGTLSGSELFHYPNNPDDPFSLHADYPTSICRDHEGTLWIGGNQTNVLYALEKSEGTKRFIPYHRDTMQGTSLWRLTRIYEDRNRNLWVGGASGLDIFDRKQKRFFRYILDPGRHDFNNEPLVNDICEAEDGHIWVGTMLQGLFRIEPPITLNQSGIATSTGTISYKYDTDLTDDLGDHPVLSICEPKVGKTAELWIGTFGGGLFGLKEEGFICYTVSDGLPDNTIWAILEDGRGYLWIATNNGLVKFDPKSGDMVVYNELNGIPLQEFGWLSGQKDKNGTFFLPCSQGLLVFNPDSMVYNQVIPPVVITDFSLFNETVPIGEDTPLKKSITETKELELSYRENYLSFEYAALNYLEPERNKYKYKMEGLDRDWIDAGYQRQAYYTSLKPGKYTFRVMGSNNDGIWNEEGASLGIVIHPPPWFRWWAYVIYGMTVLGIILWYRNFLIRRERLRADLKLQQVEVEKVRELDRMKTRFFSSISHEFRTPLTLILGPLEKLTSDRPKAMELDWNVFHSMKRNARKLKGLINQILDLSKLETGQMKLRVSQGDATGFLKNIVLSFLSLAESKGIVYKFKLTQTSGAVYFDGDKLDKIATNLIANAFKFTPEGGEISVRLTFIAAREEKPLVKASTLESLEFCVQDSGRGIPKDKLDRIFDRYYQVDGPDTETREGTGLGLALVKELVDLYRGEIKVSSKPGKGSTFRVRLPVSPGVFKEDEIHEQPLQEDAGYAEDRSQIQDEIGISGADDLLPDAEFTRHEMAEARGGKETQDGPILLIVEDNQDLIQFIRQSLDPGYRFHEAFNGREGLEKAREHIPDLIVSDVMMPEMDGFEMCESLKADERTSHIPIILLTAKGDMDSKIDGLETGADDYLIKPFDAKELNARVHNLIQQRIKLRERFRKEMILNLDKLELLPPDERFLEKVTEEVNRQISEADYNVKKLAVAIGVSRVQLYRKIHALTDQSPSEFIRNLKLRYAAGLFHKGYRNITEVTYKAGFNSPSYFTSCFRKLYGKNPKEYLTGLQRS